MSYKIHHLRLYRSHLHLPLWLPVCAALAWQTASALVLSPDVPAQNWRFSSGMGTANPTPNTDPSFVGLGYDWSGIGASGWGGGGILQNITMIAPNTAASANHYQPHPGGVYYFFNGATSQRVAATVAVHDNPFGDMAISTMAQSFSASDNIAVVRILDFSNGNYANLPLFHVGSEAGTGTQQIATLRTTSTDYGTTSIGHAQDSTLTYVGLTSGDSGSPWLIPYKGQLFLQGCDDSLLANVAHQTDPVTPTNAILALSGYALRYTIYDIPADTAYTANAWTGGAGSSAFGAAANWQQGSVPNRLPVVFDSTATGGQNTINLGADQNLRGMLFRTNTNTSMAGFTFAGGNTLSVGSTGIRNEDSNTQTFNSNISMTACQNWEAASGNLIFNGNIANNGNLLVVQGARNTTFGGIVSGAGGLAKDEAGSLTLNASSTYTGTTFLHNGTLILGASNALPTTTIVRFDAANPAVLDINGQTETVGDIRSIYNGTGTVAVNGGNLITGANNLPGTYAGVFTGAGSITKVGSGVWTLTGNSSSYTGSFNVSGGLLQIASAAGSATGNGPVAVNNGGSLAGSGTIGGQLTLNAGSLLVPGNSGVGTLAVNGGMRWNGGGSMLFSLGSPGTSTLLDLGSNALTKGTGLGYAVTFSNAGGMAPGLYTLMDFGSTTFSLSDFGYTNTGGFSGNFLLNSGNLQFQVLTTGPSTWKGGWTNFTSTLAAFETSSNWANGTTNNLFTENIQSGFTQIVQFQNSKTLAGPLVINFNSLDSIPPGGSPVATKGWFFLSKTSSLATLSLGGDVTVNNAFNQVSPLVPTIVPNSGVGTTVALGGANAAVGGAGYNLAAIDLGGANRTISTNMPGETLYSLYGFFVEAPLTDGSNSGASLTKAGNGNLILGAANTFTGDLNIQGGTVSLMGNGKLASRNITVSGGSEFYLTNTGRDLLNGIVSSTNRLTAPGGPNLTVRGGDIEFAGTAGQTLGFNTVNVPQGLSILHPFSNSGANATIAMAALNRTAGASLFMPGLATSGSTGNAGAYATTTTLNGGAPAPGTVIPWAYAGSTGGLNFTGFAVYNATYGFQPASAPGADANFLAGSTFSGATVATDYQLMANYALTSNTQVNSLVSGSGSSLTITSAGGPLTLTIGSGGLIFPNGGTIGSTTAANNVLLDFNHKEATIAVSGGDGKLLGPIFNANGLTVNASTLWLNFANPYNADSSQTAGNWGTTYINAGRVVLQNGGALPNTGDVTINVSTSTVNPNSSVVTSAPAALDLYGNSATIGGLNGSGLLFLASLITTKTPTGTVSGTLTLGNGGDSGNFSGLIQDTLLPVLPYGACQGNQLNTYGSVGNNLISLGVTKTGTGTQIFNGTNNYTGPTTINRGTLALSGVGTPGINSALTLSGAGSTFDISASTVTSSIGSLSGSAGTVVNLGANTLAIGGNDAPATFSGTIKGTGGGILKTGEGMLTLNGVNNFTGSTTVNSGILRLDHSTTTGSMLSASNPLVMGGGGLQIIGNASTAVNDASGGLTVNPGGSAVTVFSQTGINTALILGAITRNTGGTVDFTTVGSSAGITTSATSGAILGGWATVNGMNDWGSVAGGAIVPASTIPGAETVANDASLWGTGTANVVNDNLGFGGSTPAGSAVNSILFRGAHSSSIAIADTLKVGSGGILETASVGNNPSVITGGVLVTGYGQDLILLQNNTANSLTIGSTILAMAGLTKSGAGTVILSGNNLIYGATAINAGTVSLVGSATLGSNAELMVASNAVADFSQGNVTQTFTRMTGSGQIVTGPVGIALGSDNSSSTFDGRISGSGGIAKNGTGTLTLSGLNTFTGPLAINAGTVAVTGCGTLGIRSAVIINTANSAPAVLDLSGATTAISIGSLSGAGNLVLSPAGMTIGTDNSSTTFSGDIAGTGAFTKVGTGTLTLTGSNVAVPDTQYAVNTANGEFVNGGVLQLDYSGNAYSKIQSLGSVSMGGGSLVAIGNASNAFTQTTGYSYYINPGASSISAVTLAGGTANFAMNLNNYNRTTGGTLDFNAISGGGVASLTSRAAGLVGGFATVNGMSDWAWGMGVGSNNPIAATPTPATYSVAFQSGTYTDVTIFAGNNLVTITSGTAGLAIGQTVTGTGIPAGATITDFVGTSAFHISKNATITSGGLSIIATGWAVANPGGLLVGESIYGPNIPAGTTISILSGSAISFSNAPTGLTSTMTTIGYALGTTNDAGATISTLDNPANWTTANYGANLNKANLTDTVGFGGTLGASATINSLRINANAAANIGINTGSTLTIATGGILETEAVGAHAVSFSGGTLVTGNNKDLIFIQNNPAAAMTVSSAITGYGVTKSGSGILVLAGNTTYNGPTTVNSGTLALGGSSTVGNGTSAVTVMPGATLDLQGSTSPTQSFGSLSSISTGGGIGGGTVILGSSISTLTVGSDNTSTIFSGVIQNGAGSSAGLTKSGTGVLVLGGSNTYTGRTFVNAGTLMLGVGGAITSGVTVGNGSGIAMLAGIGTLGDVTVDSTSSTKYGILEPGIPVVGPFTIQTAGLLTTNSLSLNGTNTQVNFLLGSPAVPGSTYSTVAVHGNLTLAGAVLNIMALDAFGAGTYHLFTYTGTETGTLTLGSLPTGFTPGQFAISYTGGSVDLVASQKTVPEPGTWALLICGILLLLAGQSRRKRAA